MHIRGAGCEDSRRDDKRAAGSRSFVGETAYLMTAFSSPLA
jgi:hypothetical protein